MHGFPLPLEKMSIVFEGVTSLSCAESAASILRSSYPSAGKEGRNVRAAAVSG